MPRDDDFLLKRSPAFPLGVTQEDRTDLTLTQSTTPTGRVRGRVTNSVDGSFVDNATVKLRIQSGDPVAHTQTNPAGNYVFDELVPGTYIINVTLTGFVTTPGQTFTILGGQTLDINITITPEPQRFNTLYGVITNLATGHTVDGSNIALIPDIAVPGVNMTAVKSNGRGEYLIDGIPDGTQTLVVATFGYYLSSLVPITFSGGSTVHSDVSIQPYALPQATVNGFITQQNGTPIPNACVGLYLLDTHGVEILQQVTFTDSRGFYIFGRAAAGNYVVKAKSEKVVSTVSGAKIQSASLPEIWSSSEVLASMAQKMQQDVQ